MITRFWIRSALANAFAIFGFFVGVDEPFAASEAERLNVLGTIDRELKVLGVRQSRLFVGEGQDLVILDLTTRQFVEVGRMRLSAEAQSATWAGDIGYLAVGSKGVEVIDISDPKKPETVSVIQTPGDAQVVHLADEIAVVEIRTENGFDFATLDISDPETPELLSVFVQPFRPELHDFHRESYYYYPRCLATGAGQVVMAEGEIVHIIDISDPRRPTISGSFTSPGIAAGGTVAYFVDIEIVGTTAYLPYVDYYNGRGFGDSGMLVLDLSSKNDPKILADFSPRRLWPNCIRVVEDTAFVLTRSTFRAIDVSNPADPVGRSSVELKSTTAQSQRAKFVVSGGHAFIAMDMGGLWILDVSVPDRLTEVGRYRARVWQSTSTGVWVEGNLIVVEESGIRGGSLEYWLVVLRFAGDDD